MSCGLHHLLEFTEGGLLEEGATGPGNVGTVGTLEYGPEWNRKKYRGRRLAGLNG